VGRYRQIRLHFSLILYLPSNFILMKYKFLFYAGASLVIVLISSSFSQAQKLAGMTFSGGKFGGGTIFRINADGNQYTNLQDFQVGTQYPKIILGKDGALYGTTSVGGSRGLGTIFKMNIDGSNYKTLYEFDINSGAPYTRLLQASDGKFYGIANYSNHQTTLYGINTDGSGFTILKSFGNNDYIGDLYEAIDGKIYALTVSALGNNFGRIFSINKDGAGYTVVYNFPNGNGAAIQAALIQDFNGTFYGIDPGGTNNKGIIYTLESNGTGFIKIYDFDGQSPESALTIGLDGNLYGGCSGGQNNSGMIFTIKKDGTGFKKIYDLTISDGNFLNQQLLQDSNGFLYGTTWGGGLLHAGVIFKIKPDGSNYQKIYDFDNNTSMGQYSGYIIKGNGIIYGVNNYGAAHGAGNVFSIQFDGTGYTNLHDFGDTLGSNPYGNLI